MSEENPRPARPPESRVIKRKLTANEELHTLMRGWRLRLVPEDIPGLNRAALQRRRKVSQIRVADLAGVSLAWYSRLERGDPANHSPDVLNRVAEALRLSDEECTVLHLLVAGPDGRVRRQPTPPRTRTSSIQQLIDNLAWPAWLSDPAWDIVARNTASELWFPQMGTERNIMRWAWCHPQSRTQLIDWRDVWSPRMLAQLRMANARWPDNARLKEIITEVLQTDAEARSAWEQAPALQLHPDGDFRSLYVPFQDAPMTVELVAMAPTRDPDLQVVVLVPQT